MSNVTISWVYEDFEYSIMVTASGAVVLIQTIAGNVRARTQARNGCL